MKIYLGADHGGFEAKEKIVEKLKNDGHEVFDVGAKAKEMEDDFVDYALLVVEKIVEEEKSLGILLCRNGVGMSIVANRFVGIRCVLGFDTKQVERAKNDDQVNVLALPADYLSVEKLIELVEVFIKTKVSNEPRYIRRTKRIENLGNECCGDCEGGEGCCSC